MNDDYAPCEYLRCAGGVAGMRGGDGTGSGMGGTLNVCAGLMRGAALFGAAVLAFTLLTLGMLAVRRRRLPLIGANLVGRCGRRRGGKPLGKQQYKERNE